jgi:hypothetical protein
LVKYSKVIKTNSPYESSKDLLAALADNFPRYIEFQKNLDWVNRKSDESG